jgi:YHS domain-containing protein
MDVIISKRFTKALLFIMMATLIVTLTTQASAFDDINTNSFGVAIKGYDPVAYFTDGKAVKGKSEFSYTWNEAKWYFATAANRDLFASDSERYAPQYGGY